MKRKALIVSSILSGVFFLFSSNIVNADTNVKSYSNEPVSKEAQELINNFSNEKKVEEKQNPSSSLTRSYRYNITVSFYRGSWLMWSRDNIDFIYGNGRIYSSYGYQQVGWVFPNNVVARGMRRYYADSNVHRWYGKKQLVLV